MGVSRRSAEFHDSRRRAEVQASSRWSAPGGTLGRILESTEARVRDLEQRARELERAARSARNVPPFAAALRRRHVAVVAEIKRRSPSRGSITDRSSIEGWARSYEKGGAAAISVLTEPHHFGGSIGDLETARSATSIPLLKKDFHVSVAQLFEARTRGASAALLIARALPPSRLQELAAAADAIGLEVLIEVRDEEELERALAIDPAVIGVNNRDLETLGIDPSTAERLLPQIPADRIAVAESGVRSVDDIRRAARVGADAVLVGTHLSSAADPESALAELVGVDRRDRDG